LRVTTQAGKIVLDLFGGSGTTMIAAEKSGRHARLMELDPAYCDVIVKRWEDFTGNTAICQPSDNHFVSTEDDI
jgi:DNA modification methylase